MLARCPSTGSERRSALQPNRKHAIASGSCPRTAPPGARRKALVTADASAPGGAPRSRPPAPLSIRRKTCRTCRLMGAPGGPSMGSGRAANRKARPDTTALTAGRGSHRGDHGDAIRDVGITLNADRAVQMSIGQPLDRRGSGRVRTEDGSSGKRERFAARPEPVEGSGERKGTPEQ
jgi:hypothetical protein